MLELFIRQPWGRYALNEKHRIIGMKFNKDPVSRNIGNNP